MPPSFYLYKKSSGSLTRLQERCNFFESDPKLCLRYVWAEGFTPLRTCCVCGGGIRLQTLRTIIDGPQCSDPLKVQHFERQAHDARQEWQLWAAKANTSSSRLPACIGSWCQLGRFRTGSSKSVYVSQFEGSDDQLVLKTDGRGSGVELEPVIEEARLLRLLCARATRPLGFFRTPWVGMPFLSSAVRSGAGETLMVLPQQRLQGHLFHVRYGQDFYRALPHAHMHFAMPHPHLLMHSVSVCTRPIPVAPRACPQLCILVVGVPQGSSGTSCIHSLQSRPAR